VLETHGKGLVEKASDGLLVHRLQMTDVLKTLEHGACPHFLEAGLINKPKPWATRPHEGGRFEDKPSLQDHNASIRRLR